MQSLSHVQLFVTPWATAHQASRSITNSRSLLKLLSIKSVMTSSLLCSGLPWWLGGKESSCQCSRLGFNPWSERPPGEETGKPLQYSCLGNSMDKEAWWATVYGMQRVSHDLVSNKQHTVFHSGSIA